MSGVASVRLPRRGGRCGMQGKVGRVASRPGYPVEPAARSRPFGRVSLAPPLAGSLRAPLAKSRVMGDWALLPTYAHCPTRAQCANPLKRVLHSADAPFRPGLAMQRRCAPRPVGARDRGSVASLPAPAPLAHTDGSCIAAPVAPLRARESIGTRRETNAPALSRARKAHLSLLASGERHVRYRQHSGSVSHRHRLRERAALRRDTRSATSSTPARSGTKTTRWTR